MALFGLFGDGKLSPAKIDKIAKLAANPFAQPDVRMREMERLLNDGSPEALRGVLKRFAANASGHIADEEEKQWLEEELVEVGEPALMPLRNFIGSEDKLTYALRAYRGIAGDDEAVRFFVETLERFGPDDHRAVEAKLQLVHELGELVADPRVLPALVPFVLDHSDDVAWAVLDRLDAAFEAKTLSEALIETLRAHLTEIASATDEGPRLQRRAVETLAAREWQLTHELAELPLPVGEEYFVDKKLFVRKRLKK